MCIVSSAACRIKPALVRDRLKQSGFSRTVFSNEKSDRAIEMQGFQFLIVQLYKISIVKL